LTLVEYAQATIGALIDQVAEQSLQAARDASEEPIHDLRVAIRRLSETLRVFEDVCPGGAAADVRKDLKQAMRLAGVIRNHDIALELANKAKVSLHASFEQDRAHAVSSLGEVLVKWNQVTIFEIWRTQLSAQKIGRRASVDR
jgi:CHAD domain-containing protein